MMKDFLGVFALISVVMGTLALFAYLAFSLNFYGWAIFQIVISTGIILFCIWYFRSRRPSGSSDDMVQ
jgi:hypothetical protein